MLHLGFWRFSLLSSFIKHPFVVNWVFSHRQAPVQTWACVVPLSLWWWHLPPQNWHAGCHIQGNTASVEFCSEAFDVSNHEMYSLTDKTKIFFSNCTLLRVSGSSVVSTASLLLSSGKRTFSSPLHCKCPFSPQAGRWSSRSLASDSHS